MILGVPKKLVPRSRVVRTRPGRLASRSIAQRLMDPTRARRRRRLARRRTDGRRASHRLSHRSSARHVSLARASTRADG